MRGTSPSLRLRPRGRFVVSERGVQEVLDLLGQGGLRRSASVRLDCGLRVRACILDTGEQQLSLTRTREEPPTLREAEACRQAAGWMHVTVERGTTAGRLPCLLVTQVGA